MSIEEDNPVCVAGLAEWQAFLLFCIPIIGIIWTYSKAVHRCLVIEHRETGEADEIALQTATANWRVSEGQQKTADISSQSR
uniref:Frizzled/Smoothened transmembrane domain-containing protein n=1 Tax=Trichuris muris TaxID=70415 RepID=A0A5S6QT10_TRIMR